MKNESLRVILVGPCSPALNNSSGGGAVRSFNHLVTYFKAKVPDHQVIDTQHAKGQFSTLKNLFHVLKTIVALINKFDIVFLNLSQGGIKFLSPLVYIICRLWGRKLVVRPFGGAMTEVYEQYGQMSKWIFRNTTLRADLLLFQTKHIVTYFNHFTSKVRWLPTSRFKTSYLRSQKKVNFQKRFVFLGHVKKTKGIDDLLYCIDKLDSSYTVHIYGDIIDEEYHKVFATYSNVYKGVLKSEEVERILATYDVLILPTYYSGEGYPGAIIEAYAVGLPVISTIWNAIPEIVEHTKTGMLVPIQSPDHLLTAMQSINADNYSAMSESAQNYFRQYFDAENVNQSLIGHLQSLT